MAAETMVLQGKGRRFTTKERLLCTDCFYTCLSITGVTVGILHTPYQMGAAMQALHLFLFMILL